MVCGEGAPHGYARMLYVEGKKNPAYACGASNMRECFLASARNPAIRGVFATVFTRRYRMKLNRLCLCLLTLMFSLHLAAADGPTFPGVGGGPPDALPAPAFTKVIPNLDFDQLPLDQVIMVLRQNEPDFQAVIRYSGDSQDSPPVKLQLKNVTISQVLDVLSKKYGWGIEAVEAAGHPPIYVIAVGGQKSAEWTVSAYCLTPIVDDQVARKTAGTAHSAEDMKKLRSAALADVVATVDTAVKMASDGEAVMIEVHEPTEMLIMRTAPKQREAAERVLKALDPGVTVVKAEGADVPHRGDPFFSGGPGGSSDGSIDVDAVRREIEKMQRLEAQQAQGKVDQAEADIVRRLYEKRIRELQQDAVKQLQQEAAKQANPAPATQPHEAAPAPAKN